MNEAPYAGTDNLEVMKEAVNYNRFLLDLIKTHARPGERIVDFGAGVGTFAVAMQANGYAVACIELDAAQREILAAHGLQVHATLGEIRDASVDFVYTFNVLEHIEDDVGAIRQIAGKLRAGGTLLIYVPAFALLYTSMDRKVGHLRRYKRRDLGVKVAAAGLTIETSEYVDSLGFLATLAYRFAGSEAGDINRGALRIYDRLAFPVSRCTDRILKRVIGKNILMVASKPA
jgi:SAM-dependent methyltransferase